MDTNKKSIILFQPIDANEDAFWDQFWNENSSGSVQDVFALIPANEIRKLR